MVAPEERVRAPLVKGLVQQAQPQPGVCAADVGDRAADHADCLLPATRLDVGSLCPPLNLSQGAAARLGFGSEDWRKRRPELITCDISGYGESGSYAGMKAYDLLVQAETGLASVTGTPDEMGRVGVSVCDIAAGMYAQTAILEALIARGTTGEGRGIKVSLFDGMANCQTVCISMRVLCSWNQRRARV